MPENAKPLDLAASFNVEKCRELLAAILKEFGYEAKEMGRKGGGEPIMSLRIVARAVAVEAGFHPKAIATACNCTTIAAKGATKTIQERIERQANGGTRHLVPDQWPIAPVLERARVVKKSLDFG